MNTSKEENVKQAKESPKVYHAWYSLKQENSRRYSFMPNSFTDIRCKVQRCPGCLYYKRSNGERVEVTMVSESSDHGCNTEYLDDITYRGVVCEYAGICRK
jgi:hypothetical protein